MKEKIDRARYREEVMKRQQEETKKGPEGYIMIRRARIRLIENQLKEAQVGKFTIQADEPPIRMGTEKAPTPLQYFTAGIGF